jgi:4-amino-4-deoxy-L-arabinose transferase-like glycosyltransferase
LENKKLFAFSLFAILLLHLSLLRLNVMEVDSAQLAEIARELMLSKNWWELKFLGEPYLDKPHLLFWLSAFSMKIFGVSSWAYKLPSLLFSVLTVFSTYRFTKLYYSANIAQVAAIISASILSMFVATNDVRSDSVLTGSVMFSCWQLGALFLHRKTTNAIFAGIGLALALSAKGPIGIMVPSLTFLPILFKKETFQHHTLGKIGWLIVVFCISAFPILFAHFYQFGIEGIKFFLWTQSFGRITGESSWSNHPDTFFSIHTTAWAFLPFTLFLVFGLGNKIVKLLNPNRLDEMFSLSGFVLSLFALSLSKYQLPHYFYVTYPLGAVIAATALPAFWQEKKWFRGVHYLLAIAAPALAVTLALFVFPQAMIIKMVVVVCAMAIVFVWILAPSFYTIVVFPHLYLVSVLSFVFFPELLKFQGNTAIGKVLFERKIKAEDYTVYKHWRVYALSFESQTIPVVADNVNVITERAHNRKHYVVTETQFLSELEKHFKTEEIFKVADFPISQLNIHFLNPHSRLAQTNELVLLSVEGLNP